MKGRLLYSPKLLNRLFHDEFRKRGWKELRSAYTIEFENRPRIEAYKQINFVKQKVLAEVQLGKYAFMFYDMAKFQYFYNEGKAELGIEIVPCHTLHKEMSTGVSYGEQLVYDIERLRRTFPAVPVRVILIDVERQALYA